MIRIVQQKTFSVIPTDQSDFSCRIYVIFRCKKPTSSNNNYNYPIMYLKYYIYIYIYIRGAFNRFPDFFFVQAFKIVVDS